MTQLQNNWNFTLPDLTSIHPFNFFSASFRNLGSLFASLFAKLCNTFTSTRSICAAIFKFSRWIFIIWSLLRWLTRYASDAHLISRHSRFTNGTWHLIRWVIQLLVKPLLLSPKWHREFLRVCRDRLLLWLYRVGQKSKLLILRKYVNKSENIGWTWTNTNSCREHEALSNIFT